MYLRAFHLPAIGHAERSFSAEGFYRVYPSAEKPMNRTFAEKLKLLKEKQGILPCYAIRVEKHQKHPVVFEKAPVLFLKALDLFKKHPCL